MQPRWLGFGRIRGSGAAPVTVPRGGFPGPSRTYGQDIATDDSPFIDIG